MVYPIFLPPTTLMRPIVVVALFAVLAAVSATSMPFQLNLCARATSRDVCESFHPLPCVW